MTHSSMSDALYVTLIDFTPLHSPCTHPTYGAKGPVVFEEELADWSAFAFGFDAPVIVKVILPTVLGLVCVREPRIKLGSLELYFGRL